MTSSVVVVTPATAPTTNVSDGKNARKSSFVFLAVGSLGYAGAPGLWRGPAAEHDEKAFVSYDQKIGDGQRLCT
jgi:hypothetical protein